MSNLPACPLCGGATQLRYSGCLDLEYFIDRTADFRRCESCGLVFMHPLPRTEELEELYPASYHNFAPPSNVLSAFLLDRFHDRHAMVCRRYLESDGKVLEIGAAGGDLLERLTRQGYRDVQGVELSVKGCENARAKGLRVHHCAVENFETDDRFDLIFMSHVIEHVVDPLATIVRLVSLLEPDGVLYVETPNVRALDARAWGRHWGLIHYPRHLHLFDRHTLTALLEGCGLRVESLGWEINSCGWALSVQSVLRRLGLDRSRRPRSFYYPVLLLVCLPLNAIDLIFGGTAFMAVAARKSDSLGDA